MKPLYSTLLTALGLAAALTGCSSTASGPAPGAPSGSSTSSAKEAPTPSLLPAGKFKLTTKSGAVIQFTLPSPPTDPAVADIEAYRVKAEGAPVSYLVADVDNRKGSEAVNMYRVNAFDAEGRQYTFSAVTDAMGSWKPSYGADYKYRMPSGKVLDEATGTALYNQWVELSNANPNFAPVAARKTMVLASKSTDLPSQFTRVAVMPSGGFGEEDASPAN